MLNNDNNNDNHNNDNTNKKKKKKKCNKSKPKVIINKNNILDISKDYVIYPPKTEIEKAYREQCNIKYAHLKCPHCTICGDTLEDDDLYKITKDRYLCVECHNIQQNSKLIKTPNLIKYLTFMEKNIYEVLIKFKTLENELGCIINIVEKTKVIKSFVIPKLNKQSYKLNSILRDKLINEYIKILNKSSNK
jgi:hypothetical protein